MEDDDSPSKVASPKVTISGIKMELLRDEEDEEMDGGGSANTSIANSSAGFSMAGDSSANSSLAAANRYGHYQVLK